MTDEIINWAIDAGAGRVATAEDQARALLFLGSDLASYVNGVNLLVDGGYTAALQMGRVALPGQYSQTERLKPGALSARQGTTFVLPTRQRDKALRAQPGQPDAGW